MDRFKREREWTSYIPDKRSKICDEDLLKSSLDTLRYVTLFDSEMKCDFKGNGSKETSEISSEPIASTFGSMPQQLNPRVSKLQPHPLQVEYKNDGRLYSSIEFKEYTCAEKTKDVVNLGPYLCMPQSEAAKILGLPASTLSKRWKEAVPNRKWPYRIVLKIDKDIIALILQIEKDSKADEIKGIPLDLELSLGLLLRKRQRELKPVNIRL